MIMYSGRQFLIRIGGALDASRLLNMEHLKVPSHKNTWSKTLCWSILMTFYERKKASVQI